MKTEALFRSTAAYRRFTFVAAALAVLALPVAAALNVLVRHMHQKYRQSDLYNSSPESDS